MNQILRKFEAQRPSLPSAPKPYRPFLQLSKADIVAMFPIDVAATDSPSRPSIDRRLVLVLQERHRRRRSLFQQAQDLGRNLLRLKPKYSKDDGVEVTASTPPLERRETRHTRYTNVVLYDDRHFDTLDAHERVELGRSRHSLPFQ